MKKLLLPFFLFIVINLFAQEKFQLATPLLKYKSTFFAGSTKLEVTFSQPGEEIYYTLDGKEPTIKDLHYTGPIKITAKTTVKLKAIGNNYLSSETVTMEFIKDGKSIKGISYSAPNEFYAKAGKDILNDNIGGLTNFAGGTWLGYNSDSAVINVTLKKEEKISSVLVSMLVDESSWIFMPDQIEVFYMDGIARRFFRTNKTIFDHETPIPKRCISYELEPGGDITTNQLRLVFSIIKKIPDRHPGKGSHGWLFIDEIKVY